MTTSGNEQYYSNHHATKVVTCYICDKTVKDYHLSSHLYFSSLQCRDCGLKFRHCKSFKTFRKSSGGKSSDSCVHRTLKWTRDPVEYLERKLKKEMAKAKSKDHQPSTSEVIKEIITYMDKLKPLESRSPWKYAIEKLKKYVSQRYVSKGHEKIGKQLSNCIHHSEEGKHKKEDSKTRRKEESHLSNKKTHQNVGLACTNTLQEITIHESTSVTENTEVTKNDGQINDKTIGKDGVSGGMVPQYVEEVVLFQTDWEIDITSFNEFEECNKSVAISLSIGDDSIPLYIEEVCITKHEDTGLVSLIVEDTNCFSILPETETELVESDIHENKVKLGEGYEDKAELGERYEDKAELREIYEDKAELREIYEDKAQLTEIYEDKAELRNIYGDKAELREIYEDKAEIGEIYENNAELTEIYEDKAELRKIYENKAELREIYEDNAEIGEIYEDKAELKEIYENKAELGNIYKNKVEPGEIYEDKSKLRDIYKDKAEPAAGTYEGKELTELERFIDREAYMEKKDFIDEDKTEYSFMEPYKYTKIQTIQNVKDEGQPQIHKIKKECIPQNKRGRPRKYLKQTKITKRRSYRLKNTIYRELQREIKEETWRPYKKEEYLQGNNILRTKNYNLRSRRYEPSNCFLQKLDAYEKKKLWEKLIPTARILRKLAAKGTNESLSTLHLPINSDEADDEFLIDILLSQAFDIQQLRKMITYLSSKDNDEETAVIMTQVNKALGQFSFTKSRHFLRPAADISKPFVSQCSESAKKNSRMWQNRTNNSKNSNVKCLDRVIFGRDSPRRQLKTYYISPPADGNYYVVTYPSQPLITECPMCYFRVFPSMFSLNLVTNLATTKCVGCPLTIYVVQESDDTNSLPKIVFREKESVDDDVVIPKPARYKALDSEEVPRRVSAKHFFKQ